MSNDHEWLANQFEAHRAHLRAVAYRMLGSASEADDAVQEAWLKLSGSDTSEVRNLGGWLTTVVGRVCLDMLRSRKSRHEEPLDERPPETIAGRESRMDPEQQALMADSVGLALLVVLESLTPAERVAFVLHDMFDLSFDEIARIVDRTPAAARQLASRARRRVRGAGTTPEADLARRRTIVDAFLAASREGDFQALLTLLDPDVVMRVDEVAVRLAQASAARGAPSFAPEVHGAEAVAEIFKGRARGARPVLIDGAVGAAWAPGGQPRSVFDFTVENGKIIEISVVADPERIAQLDVVML